MASQERTEHSTPYQDELKIELNKLIPADFAHASRLLAEEMKRVQSGDKYRSVSTIQLHHDRPSSNAVKIMIPVKEFPNFNYVGKLLGPRGNTLRGLQEATGCKLSILGRGSMRDRNKEEELRKEGGKYAHLNDELHVMVECFADAVDAYGRISNAIMEIKKFMVPDMQDDISMQQMQEMMYLNGQEETGAPPQRGRGRGGPPARGMSGPPSRGFPPTRGAPRGGAPTRGGPPSRGAPAMRGSMSDRGAPRGRGAPPMRGAPMGRGAPPSRGASSSHGPPTSRGGYTPRGGSSMSAPPPRTQTMVQDSYDYGHGASSQSYEDDVNAERMATDSYDTGYSNTGSAYAEDAYAEQAAPRETPQYFDYGHGDSRSSYDDYGSSSATSAYDDRAAMKAPPSRAPRGLPRSHPYESRMLPPRRGAY